MPLTKVPLKPGVDKEITSYAVEGTWYNCDKTRFRMGYPEKIGGWINYSPGYTFSGCAHTLWIWVTYSSENLCAVGTNQKYYVELGGQFHDITPLMFTDYLGNSTPVTLPNNPFTTTAGSLLVNVGATGHSETANSFVTFSGATAVGGLTLNGEFEIVSIVDTNNYSILAPTAATSSATGGGNAVLATYPITASNAVVTVANGWGAGGWGSGTWSNSAGSLLLSLRLWSQSNFLQDLIFAPAGGPIYYWPKDTATFNRAITLEAEANGQIKTSVTGTSAGVGNTITVSDSTFIDFGAMVSGTNVTPGTYVIGIAGQTITLSANTTGAAAGVYTISYSGFAVPNATNYIVASDTQQFTIAFGANPYDPTNFNTQFDPMLVRWSDQRNPYDWTPTDSNQAGEQHLSNGSFLITAQNTYQQILVWSDSAIYSMQFLGPPYVWGINLIMDNISIASPNAAITVNNITYWMGQDKFYAYSGVVNTLPCTLKRFVFSNINTTQLNQVVCGTNEGFDEVWWFYPSANSNVNDSYIIYNHTDQIWSYGTLNRSAWLDSPLRILPTAVFSLQNSYLATAIGTTDTSVALLNGSSYPATGTVQIGSEYITYTGITGNTLTGCIRGATFNGNTSVAASHVIYSTVTLGIPNQLIYHETGADDGTLTTLNPIPSYIESADFEIADGQNLVFVWRMVPDFTFTGSTSTNPQIILTVRPRLNPGSSYVTPVDQPFVTQTVKIPVEQYTGEVYTRIRGRQMSIRVDSSMLGVKWQMGNTRIDPRLDGRR